MYCFKIRCLLLKYTIAIFTYVLDDENQIFLYNIHMTWLFYISWQLTILTEYSVVTFMKINERTLQLKNMHNSTFSRQNRVRIVFRYFGRGLKISVGKKINKFPPKSSTLFIRATACRENHVEPISYLSSSISTVVQPKKCATLDIMSVEYSVSMSRKRLNQLTFSTVRPRRKRDFRTAHTRSVRASVLDCDSFDDWFARRTCVWTTPVVLRASTALTNFTNETIKIWKMVCLSLRHESNCL